MKKVTYDRSQYSRRCISKKKFPKTFDYKFIMENPNSSKNK